MTRDEVMAMSDEELNSTAARLDGWRPPEQPDAGMPVGLMFHSEPDGEMWYDTELDRKLSSGRRVPVEEVNRAVHWHTDDGRAASGLPNYCHDIAAAWELVESVRENALRFQVGNTRHCWDSWWAEFRGGKPTVYAESAPKAITRAFVLAMDGKA